MTDRWLQPINAAMSTMGFDNVGGYALGGDPTQGLGGVTGRTGRQGDPTLQGWSPTVNLGTDLLMDQALPAWDAAMAQKYPDQSNSGSGGMAGWTSGGSVANAGGAWANLDTANNDIASAASKYGVPANLLKAMIMNESSGDWNRDGSRVVSLRGDRLLPYVGIFGQTAQSWGYDFNQLIGNRSLQIDAMANGMKRLYSQIGNWDGVITTYFSGHAQPTGWADENGMTDFDYLNKTKQNVGYLDSLGGSGWNTSTPGSTSGWTGANSLVDLAQKYVGTQYIWGAVPGKGADPRQTGWDCSGMTYWLDQNYGTGTLPQGSHYQYQWAQQNNTLFTDPGQLKAGDLVFFDTGPDNGGGANLNRAGHVAMYLGNGKMLHAANPTTGTIISDLSSYIGMYGFLGATHMSWSGGGVGYSGAYSGSTQPQQNNMWATSPANFWQSVAAGNYGG